MNTARLVDAWGKHVITFGFAAKDGPFFVLGLQLLMNWSDLVNIPDDSYFMLTATNRNGTVVWRSLGNQFDIMNGQIQYEGLTKPLK